MKRKDYQSIATQSELVKYLEVLRRSPWVAIDTEFISEGRYEPELCLIQVAAENGIALIDPLAVDALTPFWEILCEETDELLVHACRSEMEFCFRATGRLPGTFFDVQLAAGFVGLDYPAGFRTLLDRVMHLDLPKAEARTDWLKRPLTPRQIEYAIGDVLHLRGMSNRLLRRLKELRRLDWFGEESAILAERLKHDFQTPRWRNMPKSGHLKPRELAVVRAVWLLRDRTARRTNQVSARVLRDDLIVELARKGSADPKRLASIRGLPSHTRFFEEMVGEIRKALELPEHELPAPTPKYAYPQYAIMTQFLYAALGLLCRQYRISLHLVGGPNDVRELIAHTLGTLPEGMTPRLASGWRARLLGDRLQDLLDGKTAIRLLCHDEEIPLEFIPFSPNDREKPFSLE